MGPTLSSFQRWRGGLGGGGTMFWQCYEPLQKRNVMFYISPKLLRYFRDKLSGPEDFNLWSVFMEYSDLWVGIGFGGNIEQIVKFSFLD